MTQHDRNEFFFKE